MPTISHKNLATTQLHPTKGVSAATDDYVLTVTSGAEVYKKLTAINLTGTGNPFGAQLLHCQDVQTSGTVGQTFASSAWNQVRLNTATTNEITSATLTSNQISLLAGTYFLDARLTAGTGNSGSAQLRMRNITDSTTLRVGLAAKNQSSSANYLLTLVMAGRFTLSGTKTIELQYWSSSPVVNAAVSSGESEIYSDVFIWKVA